MHFRVILVLKGVVLAFSCDVYSNIIEKQSCMKVRQIPANPHEKHSATVTGCIVVA